MALISRSGQVSLRSVLNTMGVGAVTNYPFSSLNAVAMGGTPSANSNAANSLCMPYQTGASASLGYNGVGAPNAAWTARNGSTWGEHTLNEFRGGYSGKPRLSLGWQAAGNSSWVYINVTGLGSDAYTGAGTPYYFYITGASGTTTGWNAWRVAQSSGNFTQYLVTSTGYRAWFTVYVQDFTGCGNRFEFAASVQYY